MSDENLQPKSLVPHYLIGALVVALVVAGFLWLQEDTPPTEPTVVSVSEPEPEEPTYSKPIDDVVESNPTPPPVEEPEPVVTPKPEAIEEIQPEPEPLDISDAAIKTALLTLTNYDLAASLLVNEDLLRRFVVTTDNMARGDTAPNHLLLTPPNQSFRVYQQAGKEWIDAASYKRYTAYVDVFDEMEVDKLISLYRDYKPAVEDIFAEIGDPDDDFDYVLIDAINHLLDTPEVPMPVEVYTESVMYKYRDERLESLSAPQKHLLRTGPENMRRIKAKLRELKDAL